MNIRISSITASFAFLWVLSSGLAQAQDSSAVKPETTPAGIEYVSGGVGDQQQEAMKALREDYNLRLTFARQKSGEYLADVKVIVENARKEKVLDAMSKGPLLFAKLPDGTYKVTAEFEGQRQTKMASVKSGRPRGLVYYF